MSLEDRAAVTGEASMAVDQLPPGADTDRLLALQQKAHACAQQAQQLAARAAELGVTQYSGSVSTAPLSSTQGEEADSQQQHPDEAGRLPGEQEQQPADASREGQQPAKAVGQEQLSGEPDRLQQPAEAVQQAARGNEQPSDIVLRSAGEGLGGQVSGRQQPEAQASGAAGVQSKPSRAWSGACHQASL